MTAPTRAITRRTGQPARTDRGWTDSDNDKVVDCNLLVLTQNGECAGLTGNALNFGSLSATTTITNPDTLKGWGVRENDWQWGVTVQQELAPRMSVEVGYARRWWHGFTVTDNLLRGPEDYEAWTITAPSDPRLPNGGGYPINLHTVDAGGCEPWRAEHHHIRWRLHRR